MSSVAATPKPPYNAVIFTSLRTDGDNGYAAMADGMVELAARQPGFLGIEPVRENLGGAPEKPASGKPKECNPKTVARLNRKLTSVPFSDLEERVSICN